MTALGKLVRSTAFRLTLVYLLVFAVYAAAAQPTLLRLIEGLWLQTGPYMNLLYPDIISRPHGPQGRAAEPDPVQ